MTEDPHRAIRESLGAYALGQLDLSDEAAVRAHLPTCELCQAELAELQPVADALAGARRRTVTGGPTPPALQRRVTEAIAAEESRRRRTRLITSITALAAAAALVVAVAVGITTFSNRAPQVPVEAVAVQVAAELEQVTAEAGLIDHTWGVEVKLTTAGLAAGTVYEAFVLGEDGGEVPAGTFVAIGNAEMLCNLQASVLREDASGFEIRDVAGEVVMSSDF